MKKILFLISFTILSIVANATVWTVDSLNNTGYGSLRAAVDSANNSDTVRFNPNLIASGSDTISLWSSILFNKSLTVIGLYTTTDTLYVSGNNADRIFYKSAYQGTQSRMVLDSLVLINGVGSLLGGAIYSGTSDSIFISNTVIKNCSSTGNGGGIYSGDAPITLINTIIEGNNASYGGGLYANAPVLMDGCQIIGNSATQHGGGIFTKAPIKMYNSTISYNQGKNGGGVRLSGYKNNFLAENSSINYNQAQSGGAIDAGYIDSFSSTDSSSIFNLMNTDIIGNTSLYYAGAIRGRSERLEFYAQNCKFNQNQALTSGRIIRFSNIGLINYYKNHLVFIVDSCEFNNNISTKTAISVSAIDSNVYSLTNCSIDSNKSSSVTTTVISLFAGDSASQIIVDNCTVNHNDSIYSTIAATGGGMSIGSNIGSLFITNSQFNDNGGIGMYISGHYDTLVIQDNFFDRNKNIGGLKIILDQQDTVRIENCSISENSNQISGGGLTVFARSLIIENSDISNNSAEGSGACNGGAIAVGDAGTVSNFNISIFNSTIDNNTANYQGGGIFIEVTDTITFDFDRCTFIGDSAQSGGGVFLKSYSSWSGHLNSIVGTIDECSFKGNSGIYVMSTSLSQYVPSEAILDITRSTFDGSNSNNGSKPVFVGVSNSGGIANLSMKNSTVSNYHSGSAIMQYSINGQLDLVNTTFVNNQPSVIGSSTISATGSVFVKGCVFSKNDTIDFYHAINFGYNFVSGGYNIYENTNLPNLHATDLIGVDSISLNMGSLSNNGGYTQTMLPMYPSVALNSGNPNDTSMAQNGPIYGVREVGAAESCIYTGTDIQYACDSLTWLDGITYYANTDTATITYINSIGCDSIVTLNLTITSDYKTDTVLTCNMISYNWIDGVTYYSSNYTATDTLINSWGCDSIITLNLTMSNTVVSTDFIELCDQVGYTWINGVTYTANNFTATDTLVNSIGCDSIVTLNLTFNSSSYFTDTVVSCNSYYTWINGLTYTSSNSIAMDTLVNIAGCDSIVTLHLTLNSISSIDTVTTCDVNSYIWINGITYTYSTNIPSDTLLNIWGCDSVVYLNLSMNYSTFGTDTIIACDSLTWSDGITYTSNNNMATDTVSNSVGCDSVITLNLTIINSTTSIDTNVTCDSLLWIDGITYYSSNNTAIDTLINSSGCDSIVTLDLTINNNTAIDTVNSCLFYTWIDGVVYLSNNNTATHTLTNSLGCDSVITLNLTINNFTAGIDTQIVCDSLVWIDGNTYYQNNSTTYYTIFGGNSVGCDSIVTLNLTILNSTSSIDTLIACDSLTWINGITYTASNFTAMDTLVNQLGCDSIITLNLTINNTEFATDTIVTCDSITWINGITYTSSNNTAIDTLINAVGCDSIVTLNLTINYSFHLIDTVLACESYTWIDGVTYTASNYNATVALSTVSGCDSIITLNLTISNLNSNFSWLDNGSANYYFTNTSTGNFTNSHWAFGDGSSTSAFSTSHHYSANGLYVVVLAIYDSNVVGNSCISYFTDTIVVTGASNSTSCNAGWVVFTDSTNGGVTIVNSSTGTNLTYLWSFGDGTSSSLQFPSHTYASNGPFNLCLTVDDGNGCSDTYCDSISSNGVLFKNGFDLNVVANYPLGVQNIGNENEVKIYPNPTSSTLNIKTQNFKINKILIRDNSGKVVITITSNFNVVNVESLATGVYHIELIGENEKITKKFIKQ